MERILLLVKMDRVSAICPLSLQFWLDRASPSLYYSCHRGSWSGYSSNPRWMDCRDLVNPWNSWYESVMLAPRSSDLSASGSYGREREDWPPSEKQTSEGDTQMEVHWLSTTPIHLHQYWWHSWIKSQNWDISIKVRKRCRDKEKGRGERERERDSPRNDGAPYQKSGLNGEKHPKEAMVSLSYTVSQPGTVMVESPHTSATCVAVLCSKRTVQSTYPTVPLGGSNVIARIILCG